jgi:hypothetical protein
MLVTFSEAAKIAGVSKGAIRKAALETRKLRTDRDEQGVWRVDVADIQRLWPQRPSPDTVTAHQGSPVIDGDSHQEPGVIRELQARLEAAERRVVDKDDVIADLRRRLDREGEERLRLTALLTDQRTGERSKGQIDGFWARLMWLVSGNRQGVSSRVSGQP